MRVREVADQVAVAAPEAARGLAVEVVPFRPAGRKAADLIAAGADVPWLGDQLDVGEHRVLPHRGEERRVAIEAAARGRACVARSKRKPSTWKASTH